MTTIKELYAKSDCMSVSEFAKRYHFNIKTVYSWINGIRTPPDYVIYLLEEKIKSDSIKDVL